MLNSLRIIEDIVRLTCKRAEPLQKVCARLQLTSQDFQKAIKLAEDRGYQIRIRDGHIFSQVAVKAAGKVVQGDTKPGRKQVAMWTDTHFGCRHSAEDVMVEHLTRCWEAGARVAVHTGDLLDGNRPVLLGDQDHVGFDSQSTRLRRTLKKAPPFAYVAIDGNHDGYYSSAIGSPSGAIVASRLREAGVNWTFAGVCEGRATIHGSEWFLWHPHGGSTSREGVRKVLEGKARGLQERIDIIAMGHLHKFVSFTVSPERIQAICSGTFQRQRSEFANRMSDPWDIGSALVSFDLAKDGSTSAWAADFLPARA